MCRDLWIKLQCPSLEGYRPTDGVSMSRNVQGSVDKNSGAPPWRDTGQWMEFPCAEMCRGLWIKTPVPLLGGIRPTDGVSMSGNVQGSMDKNPDAPPWRDTGQQTEFPCSEMCRSPWIKTPVPLPGGIRANGQSFHVRKCAGVHKNKSVHP